MATTNDVKESWKDPLGPPEPDVVGVGYFPDTDEDIEMPLKVGDLQEYLDQLNGVLELFAAAALEGPRIRSAQWDKRCPRCGTGGAVFMVGVDGSIRAQCLGELGPDYLWAQDDPACHGTYEVDPESNHWIVSSYMGPSV